MPSCSISSPISGAGDEDEVVARRQPVGEAPEGLAQGPLDPVAVDRAADLAADRDAEPHVLALLVLRGKRVEDEIAGRMRGAVAIDAVELAAAREARVASTPSKE